MTRGYKVRDEWSRDASAARGGYAGAAAAVVDESDVTEYRQWCACAVWHLNLCGTDYCGVRPLLRAAVPRAYWWEPAPWRLSALGAASVAVLRSKIYYTRV